MYRYLVYVALFSSLAIFVIPSVTSFGGDGQLDVLGGPVPGEGVCSDDKDNDKDGLTDEEDPGCTRLYANEESEYDMRDSDLTYVMEDYLNEFTGSHPGFIQRNFFVARGDSPDRENGKIIEYYLEQRGYPYWAGHKIKEKEISFSDSVAGTDDYQGLEPAGGSSGVAVNYPAEWTFAPYYYNIWQYCGNGVRDPISSGGTLLENNDNCPEDFGFPDQLRNEDGEPRTQVQSNSGDISSQLKDNFEADVGITHVFPSQQEDNPDYTMDFVGVEDEGTYTEDITSPGSDPTSEIVYEHDGIWDAPDFYASGRNLVKIFPYASETEIDKVKDVDLVKETGITDYDYDWTKTDFRTDCRFPDGTYNVSCDSDGGTSYCTGSDYQENNVKNYSLTSDPVDLTQNTERYEIKNTEDNEEIEDPGYKEDFTDLDGIEITVNREVKDGYSTHEADNCPSETSEAKCDYEPGNSAPCEYVTTSKDIYTDSGFNIDGVEPGASYTDTDSGKTSFKYEEIEIRQEPIFSTVFDNNEGMDSDINSTKALFEGDYPLGKIKYEGIYYSPEISEKLELAERRFGNSPSVSISSFDIMVQDNKFHSRRDYYSTFNIDGKNGLGDSYVAVKEGKLTEGGSFLQDTEDFPAFDRDTVVTSGSGAKIGPASPEPGSGGLVELEDFQESSEVPDECPEEPIFCVTAVDLSMKPWDEWESPSEPDFEFEEIDTVHVNESWGACRKYQELIGGARESILRCQYDWGEHFPGEPVPYNEPEVIPDNGDKNP